MTTGRPSRAAARGRLSRRFGSSLVADVRFGSFATDPFRAGADQCPLCLQ